GAQLQAAQEVQAQTAAEASRLDGQVQAATQDLQNAEQALAGKSANLAPAQAAFAQARQSTLAFQAQADRKTTLQGQVSQLNLAYQQALQALHANHDKGLRAGLKLQVSQARAGFAAATRALKLENP